jgi:hypothetical protein
VVVTVGTGVVMDWPKVSPAEVDRRPCLPGLRGRGRLRWRRRASSGGDGGAGPVAAMDGADASGEAGGGAAGPAAVELRVRRRNPSERGLLLIFARDDGGRSVFGFFCFFFFVFR